MQLGLLVQFPCSKFNEKEVEVRIPYITWVTIRLDRVSVPLPIAIDILMDTMARDRAHVYLFSV